MPMYDTDTIGSVYSTSVCSKEETEQRYQSLFHLLMINSLFIGQTPKVMLFTHIPHRFYVYYRYLQARKMLLRM